MAWRIWRGERGSRRAATTTASAPPRDAPDGRPGAAAGGHGSTPRGQVPRWLQTAAGWSWRLLLLGLLLYVIARIASALRIVVLPCVAALLLTALLQPLTTRLKRTGMPPILATWCSLLTAVAVIAGLSTLIGVRVSAEYPTLVSDVTHFGHQVQSWLAGPPFHVRRTRLEQLVNSAVNELKAHKSQVAGTVLTGGKYVVEIVAGTILTLFVGFFLIKDGDRIWAWLTGFLAPDRADRANRAGRAAWQVLVSYVRGTVLIAVIHSVVIGLTLWILRVPLVIPLIAVVFLAAFVPLVGILVAGVLAIGVTLATRGWVAAAHLAGGVPAGEPAGRPPAPAAGGRALHPAAPAGGHPRARRRRRFSRASRARSSRCPPPPRSRAPGPSCAGRRTGVTSPGRRARGRARGRPAPGWRTSR